MDIMTTDDLIKKLIKDVEKINEKINVLERNYNIKKNENDCCCKTADFLNNEFYYEEFGKVIYTIHDKSDWEIFQVNHILRKDDNVYYKDINIKLGNIIKIERKYYKILNCTDYIVVGFTNNGIILFPIENLAESKMSESNSTDGGFENSIVYKRVLPTIKKEFKEIFGATLMHIDLPDENQIFGERIYQIKLDLSEPDREQLPLFKYINYNSNIFEKYRSYFWLRAVASSMAFALATGYGNATGNSASYSHGVRPIIYLRFNLI